MTTIQSILYRLTEAVSGTDKELYTEDELNKFASFYLDKWDENTSENVIAESFTDFWWNTDRTCRRCSVCGKLMREAIVLTWVLPTTALTNAFIQNTLMRNGQKSTRTTTRVITPNGKVSLFFL